MVLLINQEYLTTRSIVDDNADFRKITPSIIVAQDLDILPLLGTDLMNKLKDDATAYETNNTPVPSPYDTLLEDYVQPALLHFTLARSTPGFKFKYAAKGIMVKNSDNSNPAESIDVDKLTDMWNNIAQEYAKRMVDYINFNTGVFPEYVQAGNTYKIYPRTDAYEVPIYLPGAPRLTEKEYYKTRFDEES